MLNKNKNKLKDKDEISTAQGQLILAQQAERRRRFQKIADENRSAEALLEETRQRVELVEEAREEFLKLCSPREDNSDERVSTCTARSADGARAWSELFVWDTLPRETTSEDPSSPPFTTIESAGVGEQSTGVGVQSTGVGVQSIGVGVQSAGVGVQPTSVAGLNNACT